MTHLPRVLVGASEPPQGDAARSLRDLLAALSEVCAVDFCAAGPSAAERRSLLGEDGSPRLRWTGGEPEAFLGLLKQRVSAESYAAILLADGPQTRAVLDQVTAFAAGVPVVVLSLPGVSGGSIPPRRRPSSRPPTQAWCLGGANGQEAVRDLLPLATVSSQRPTAAWVRARLREVVHGAVPAPKGAASVVIPAWNQLSYTKACLKSVLERTDFDCEVIVVDNGSTDGTADYVRSLKDSRLVLLRNETNLGFAKAINQGLRRARGRYCVWLNNDTVVTDGWLGRLVGALERAPWIGAVGPMTNATSGLQKAADAGYKTMAELPAFAMAWAMGHRARLAWAHRLTGFCLAHRTSVLDEIGLLDERYALGCYEDLDFCLRLRQAGYELFVAEDVFIHHREHGTFDGNGVPFLEQTRKNREVFIDKWCRHYLGVLDEADDLVVRPPAPKLPRR